MRIGAPLNHEPSPILQWIEIASTLQLPGFHLVGLPNTEVNEARERVRAAIEASGLDFPKRRLTLNLSPAYIRKRGTGVDLAIALAIIQSAADAPASPTMEEKIVAWAELGLDGTLKPVGQTLRAVYSCWKSEAALLIVSLEEKKAAEDALQLIKSAEKATHEGGVQIRGVRSLKEAWELLEHLRSGCPLPEKGQASSVPPEMIRATPPLLPLSPALERVVCVAAAGSHHILLLGPRGTGKSHALDWLSALQPSPPPGTRLRQRLVAELRHSGECGSIAPIRRVASQVKPAALLGSTSSGRIRPGELSLADGGLLVADEFPEWHRDSRECLREPLERGVITLARSQGLIELPALFTLAANGNLCPCGGWPPELPLPIEAHVSRPPRCRCGFRDRNLYLSRLSGPILERIDLVTLVLSPSRSTRARKRRSKIAAAPADPVQTLRARVEETRNRVVAMWGDVPSRLPVTEIEALIRSHPDWESRLPLNQISLRTRHKIIRVVLTLSAWDGDGIPRAEHFIEAATYRPERCGLCP